MSKMLPLKQKRKEKNLQVSQISEMLGIARSTYYRYESGRIENMPSSILRRLCEILETNPQELLGWKDEPELRLENAPQLLSASELEELRQFFLYLLYRRTLSEHNRK